MLVNFLFVLVCLLCSIRVSAVELMTLKAAAAQRGVLIGGAVNREAFEKDAKYRELLAREFSIITPENAMKMSYLQPSRGHFDFAYADQLVDFAKKHEMLVRGHALVWHLNGPSWLEAVPLVEREQVFKTHIQTVVKHFAQTSPGTVKYWDVINEALENEGAVHPRTVWSKIEKTPEEFIEKAFRWAHEADPHAKLFYNDFATEVRPAKAEGLLRLMKLLVERKVPVHGVGYQMHLSEEKDYDFAKIDKDLRAIAQLGLEIHITEIDVRILLNGNAPTRAQLKRQADIYAKVAQICAGISTCKAYVTWTPSDAYAYLPENEKQWGEKGMFDRFHRPKPAALKVIDVLHRSAN